MDKALHIEAKKEDVAPIVLLPGDPLRAKYIARNFLDNPVLINKIRNMYGYTGYYKGVRVTVMSSGMGMPSMSIYALELFKYYEVEKIIRIGTCGALRADEKLFDIVIGDSYYTNSNFADSLCNEDVHLIYPKGNLTQKIIETSQELNKNTIIGLINTMDVFGPYATDEAKEKNSPRKYNPVAEEMEAFGLVYIANKLNKEAACLATVVDSPFEDKVVTPEDREKSLNDMITIALETIIK